VLGEALRQEGVEPAQAVVGIGDINQAGLRPPIQESPVDGLGSHDLAHVSDMHGTGWGYARGYGMGAGAFQLGGDDISPVNRHRPKSMREGNINLIVAVLQLYPWSCRFPEPIPEREERQYRQSRQYYFGQSL